MLSLQVTNRVLCLRNHMALAGLLNRTLVIPAYPQEVPGRYDLQVRGAQRGHMAVLPSTCLLPGSHSRPWSPGA